ncbi:MAG: hypothetical protein ACXAEU_10840 [Candidatus Hodarchaeales archaeon]|jgi:hypothetical protein
MLRDADYNFNFDISKEMIILLIGAIGLVGLLALISSGVLGAAMLPF